MSISSIPDDREDITVSQHAPAAAPGKIPMPHDEEPTVNQAPDTQFQSNDDPDTGEAQGADAMTIDEWLNKLRSSDRAFYNIMAMEIWSLAKSMDTIMPGFWSKFMVNRRKAMKEFVDRRRTEVDDMPTQGEPMQTSGEPTAQQTPE